MSAPTAMTVQQRRDELLFHAGRVRQGACVPGERIAELSVLHGGERIDAFVALVDAAAEFDQERMAALLAELTGGA